MLIRRKGELVEVDGEEEGTLADEEEEVLEEAGIDDTPLVTTPEERRRNAEWQREEEERFREIGQVGQQEEEQEVEEEEEEEIAAEEEEPGPSRPRTESEKLAEKLEAQKLKTELAKSHKEEVAAGGGGLTGLIKRTVHDVTGETRREVKRGKVKRGFKGSKKKADYGMYSVKGMRQLAVPKPSRSGAGKVSGIAPKGSGLSELRKLSTPGMGKMPIAGAMRPMSLGINTKAMKPMGLNIGAGLGVSKKLQPMSLTINTRKAGVKRSKKRIKNKRYNRNVRNLLRVERI